MVSQWGATERMIQGIRYSNTGIPVQRDYKQNRLKQASPNRLSEDSSDRFSANRAIVRFGVSTPPGGKWNVLFITPELWKASEGGLGRVAELIPKELNNPENGGLPTEVKTVIPGFGPILEEDGFEPTGIRFKLNENADPEETFEVLQKQAGNTWVYTIKNDRYFTPLKNFYTYSPNAKEADKYELNKAISLFNQALAKFAPMLNQSNKATEGTALNKFTGDAHIMMANDWPTTQVFKELPADYGAAKILMVHNENDKGQSLDEAVQNGVFQSKDAVSKVFKQYYSPLGLGIKLADFLIACRNYVDSIVTRLGNTTIEFVSPLREKQAAGLIQDMHHDPGTAFEPTENSFLKEGASQGFTILKPTAPPKTEPQGFLSKLAQGVSRILTNLANALQGKAPTIAPVSTDPKPSQPGIVSRIKGLVSRAFTQIATALQKAFTPAPGPSSEDRAELRRFKQENKLALQRMVGLNEDPNAVIFTWAARLDPNQKGLLMLTDGAREFLKTHEKAQLVIGGDGESNVKAIVEDLAKDPDLKGRIQYVGKKPYADIVKINAGSTFSVLPSLYEPFGLSQLEAMMMGTVPIVHGVDGILSSVADPQIMELDKEMVSFYQQSDRPDPKYGQTGFMMRRLKDIPAYQAATNAFLNGTPSDNEKATLKGAETALTEAMDRAYTLAIQQPEKLLEVSANGRAYVKAEHTWRKFVPMYKQAFAKAFERIQDQQKPNPQQSAA